MQKSSPLCHGPFLKLMAAWWILGLLNNFVYVVMLAGYVALPCIARSPGALKRA